jgi:hypothetical protein
MGFPLLYPAGLEAFVAGMRKEVSFINQSRIQLRYLHVIAARRLLAVGCIVVDATVPLDSRAIGHSGDRIEAPSWLLTGFLHSRGRATSHSGALLPPMISSITLTRSAASRAQSVPG